MVPRMGELTLNGFTKTASPVKLKLVKKKKIA